MVKVCYNIIGDEITVYSHLYLPIGGFPLMIMFVNKMNSINLKSNLLSM